MFIVASRQDPDTSITTHRGRDETRVGAYRQNTFRQSSRDPSSYCELSSPKRSAPSDPINPRTGRRRTGRSHAHLRPTRNVQKVVGLGSLAVEAAVPAARQDMGILVRVSGIVCFVG